MLQVLSEHLGSKLESAANVLYWRIIIKKSKKKNIKERKKKPYLETNQVVVHVRFM